MRRCDMRKWMTRLAWMAAGVGTLYALSALAGVASGGSLDPPASPAVNLNTQSLQDLAPAWHRRLFATEGGDAFGCGTHRFECVLGGGSVLDRETGIVWQRQPTFSFETWAEAESACRNHQVADVVFGARSGWRLPALHEMQSLIDAGAANPALPAGHPFQGATAQQVWTATQSNTSPGAATTVSLASGAVGSRARNDGFFAAAWCLRAPGGDEAGAAGIERALSPWAETLTATGGCNSARFTCVLNDEAVLDRETGLVWEKAPSTTTAAWNPAMDACADATTGGRLGWRLPVVAELMSLLDTSADGLPDGHPFVGATAPTDVYFTATTSWYLDGAEFAREVDLSTHSEQPNGKLTSKRHWCVRGGGNVDGGNSTPP
jgi:hypothetical protein